MKYAFLGFTFLLFQILSAQHAEELHVQRTIETFFEGFHDQDSTLMKQVTSNSLVLQTIAKAKGGAEYVKMDNFNDFLRSMASIPKTTRFEERIASYHIQIDSSLAHAWTPYEFWLNGKFHHCGVNSFQLFKGKDGWKIIYLIDTRRQTDCG